jgi:hypothetical protein
MGFYEQAEDLSREVFRTRANQVGVWEATKYDFYSPWYQLAMWEHDRAILNYNEFYAKSSRREESPE